MSYLRHASRHIHHTVATTIQDGLIALNWTIPGSTPFGAPVLRFQRTTALVGGKLPDKMSPGLVTITLGDEVEPDPEELGGALHSVELPIFIDIFMDKDAHALAAAEDIRDILLGRLAGTSRFVQVINQATGDPIADWQIELEDLERSRPDIALTLHWQVIKVTARAYFIEVVY